MAYESYKPEILASELMTDRIRLSVFRNLMYKGPRLGNITSKGSVLTIAGIGRPTVGTYTPGQNISIESMTSNSQKLYIDKYKYAAFALEDVDTKQAEEDIMTATMDQMKEAFARDVDEYLAGKYTSAGLSVTDATCISTSIIGDIAEAEQKLMEQDVPLAETKYLVVTPAIWNKLRLSELLYKTPNTDIFGANYMSNIFSFQVYISNALHVDTVNYCMAFTNQAIAFAEQILSSSTEVFRPDLAFQDAVKALNVYGSTVIRPNELCVLNLTPVSETDV